MISRFSVFIFLVLQFFLSACSTRNIYEKFVSRKPPLIREYVFATRTEVEEAGNEPVESAEVVVDEDTLYLGNQNYGVVALDRQNYAKRWTFQVKNGVSGKLLLVDGVLYFGGEDGNFYAIDVEFGTLKWKFETKAVVFARPLIVGSKILFMASDDVLYCLEKDTGKWIWHYKRTNNFVSTIRGNSTPVVVEGKVISGFSDGYLVALNLNDGNLQWEVKLHSGTKFTDIDATVVVDGNYLYVPAYDGALYCLNKKDGKTIWRVDVGGARQVLIEDKVLYLSSSDGFVYAFNKESGKILWKFELDRGVPTEAVLYGEYLAFGSTQEYFYVLHKGDGSLAYRFDVGLRSGWSSAPVIQNDKLYAFSQGGNLYVFKWKTKYNLKYFEFE
jgi:outer membrane protein assembly factor BamB